MYEAPVFSFCGSAYFWCSETEHVTQTLFHLYTEFGVYRYSRYAYKSAGQTLGGDDMDLELRAARAALETKGILGKAGVSADIADSWARSIAFGLDPLSEPREAVIAYQDVRHIRREKAELMGFVRPELELLSTQIAGTNFMAAFASADGVILDAIMDNEFAESSCAKAVRVGSVWSEQLRGTNALGLALQTGRAASVTGGEHFFRSHSGVSCVSAPIFGSRGEILGLLDASSEIAARQVHTKALVYLAANNIENRLFVETHRDQHILQFHPRAEYLTTQSVAMLAVGEDGTVAGANRRALDFLSGLDIAAETRFETLFQDRLNVILPALLRGDDLRLRDWLNSTYFARLRLTRPRRNTHAIAMPQTTGMRLDNRSPRAAVDPVFQDEQLREALRIGRRALHHGMPLRIIGAGGTGKTTLARHLHQCVSGGQIAVIDGTAASEDLDARLETPAGLPQDWVTQGGTVLIENAEKIGTGRWTAVSRFLNRLTQTQQSGRWFIILTETRSGDDAGKVSDLPFAAMPVFLPDLAERMDFDQLAKAMLTAISQDHTLATSAAQSLLLKERLRNLSDLDADLRVLAIQCPSGVIRGEHVARYLSIGTDQSAACSACSGHALREVKCQEIRRTYRQSNANIALAARKLGVSRNTVYKHVKSPV